MVWTINRTLHPKVGDRSFEVEAELTYEEVEDDAKGHLTSLLSVKVIEVYELLPDECFLVYNEKMGSISPELNKAIEEEAMWLEDIKDTEQG